MSFLLQFLRQNRPAIEERVNRLRAELEEALRDLAEFDRAELALVNNKDDRDLVGGEPRGNTAPEDKMTIKEMVIEVLGLLPEGADAMTILTHINRRFNASIQRESLSPQLSRLKADEKIRLEGRTWFLNEEGPAEAGPSVADLGVAGSPHGRPSQVPAVGSIPITSTPSHQNGSALHGDRSAGATPAREIAHVANISDIA